MELDLLIRLHSVSRAAGAVCSLQVKNSYSHVHGDFIFIHVLVLLSCIVAV